VSVSKMMDISRKLDEVNLQNTRVTDASINRLRDWSLSGQGISDIRMFNLGRYVSSLQIDWRY
jgi:hypothetical protein